MYCGGGEAVPRAGRRGDGAARGPAAARRGDGTARRSGGRCGVG